MRRGTVPAHEFARVPQNASTHIASSLAVCSLPHCLCGPGGGEGKGRVKFNMMVFSLSQTFEPPYRDTLKFDLGTSRGQNSSRLNSTHLECLLLLLFYKFGYCSHPVQINVTEDRWGLLLSPLQSGSCRHASDSPNNKVSYTLTLVLHLQPLAGVIRIF